MQVKAFLTLILSKNKQCFCMFVVVISFLVHAFFYSSQHVMTKSQNTQSSSFTKVLPHLNEAYSIFTCSRGHKQPAHSHCPVHCVLASSSLVKQPCFFFFLHRLFHMSLNACLRLYNRLLCLNCKWPYYCLTWVLHFIYKTCHQPHPVVFPSEEGVEQLFHTSLPEHNPAHHSIMIDYCFFLAGPSQRSSIKFKKGSYRLTFILQRAVKALKASVCLLNVKYSTLVSSHLFRKSPSVYLPSVFSRNTELRMTHSYICTIDLYK